MMTAESRRPMVIVVAASVAILFGIATIISGGQALFGDEAARAAVGNAVPFVLWFNFGAGFAYVTAGGGLLTRQKWASWMSIVIAAATLAVFAVFGIHVLAGGAFEMRTVGAMVLRSAVWITIAAVAARSAPWRH